MRAMANPWRRPMALEPVRAPQAFHRTLEGYRPTPLVSFPDLASRLGLAGLLVKDESRRFGLNAFKALGASWALQRLRHAGHPLLHVAAATEGNHGRAVAWAAARLGGTAHVFVPHHVAASRVEAIRGHGAEIIPVSGTYDDAVAECARRSMTEGWQVVADVGYGDELDIPGWVAEGYTTLFAEVGDQLADAGAGPPDVLLVQAGVGSLAAGAMLAHRAAGADGIRIVVVEPAEADCVLSSIRAGQPSPSRGTIRSAMPGLNCARMSLSAWPLLRDGVDALVTVDDAWNETAGRLLRGADPPIEVGPTGSAGFAGLLALLQHPPFAAIRTALGLGPGQRVLVINTEGPF